MPTCLIPQQRTARRAGPDVVPLLYLQSLDGPAPSGSGRGRLIAILGANLAGMQGDQRAAAVAADHGIVHRDLKPENRPRRS